MSRRIPTQLTDGPWPFLFSCDPERGLVKNVGVKPRERRRTTTKRTTVPLNVVQAVLIEAWKYEHPGVVDPFAGMTAVLTTSKPKAEYKFRKSHGSRWTRK